MKKYRNLAEAMKVDPAVEEEISSHFGRYYITNCQDPVQLAQDDSLNMGAMILDQNAVMIQSKSFEETYQLIKASTMLQFGNDKHSIYVSPDVTQIVIPQKIGKDMNFLLIPADQVDQIKLQIQVQQLQQQHAAEQEQLVQQQQAEGEQFTQQQEQNAQAFQQQQEAEQKQFVDYQQAQSQQLLQNQQAQMAQLTGQMPAEGQEGEEQQAEEADNEELDGYTVEDIANAIISGELSEEDFANLVDEGQIDEETAQEVMQLVQEMQAEGEQETAPEEAEQQIPQQAEEAPVQESYDMFKNLKKMSYETYNK